jgi:hypothetical protein
MMKATFIWAVMATTAGADMLPIFDAHIHYKEPAWEEFPVETIIELMDENGVAMGLVSSTPDAGTIMLWEHAPNRIVPEVPPYHGDVNSANWTKAPDIDRYIADRLDAYPHEGIGEFHIHRLDLKDEALFRDIIAMAKARDIFLHVHAGERPVRWLYSLDPDVKIIWAHTGLGEPTDVIYKLMSDFPTLVADTSLKEFAIGGFGDNLNPEWERILTEFQDRFMIGSDTYINSQWEGYSAIMNMNRAWLSLLPREIAEKIAYKNAERLFGRDISFDLIGTR